MRLNPLHELKGRRVWIIGASSGIGAACARAMAERGVILALSGRRVQKLEELRASLAGDGHIILPCDVSDQASVAAARDAVVAQFPHLDSVLFMAAQYTADHEKQRDLNTIHQTVSTNLGGMFNVVDAVRSVFLAQGFGQIALTASVAGYRGLPYGQPYSATKAAIINYAESLKIEWEPQHIDVRVICPGFVKTDLTAQNGFTMPFIITPESAANSVIQGLQSNAFEIHFPKIMTCIMKFIDALPRPAYFVLARLMRDEMLRKENK